MVDLVVIGGGVNGAGIARDAAGRGLSVCLVEQADLASATSSSSSKLIHGGLRYLEQYAFRMVAEALAEREILLRVARHLVWPARFIFPHVPQLRPRWMIRTGLFLYDHLARRSVLEGSHGVRLDAAPYASTLKPEITHGFAYSDCRVDDARLVVCNAADAARRGAKVLVRTQCVEARRSEGAWDVRLSDGQVLRAKAVVNAAGPWVKDVLNESLHTPSADSIRLVRGSHIVVPRLYEGEHAFILQNDDGRVVFIIPYEDRYTLVGTTDEPQADMSSTHASDAEVEYLCRAVNRYLARPVTERDVAWRYAGIRPLYDDGSSDPSDITRDYTLRLDDERGSAPVLSVFGGKITIYRRLAEDALEKLLPYFPQMRSPWTSRDPLPGSLFANREEARHEVYQRYSALPAELVRGVFRRHGALTPEVLGDGMVGEYFGAGLCEREVRYFKEHEWAREADDVLWRRTKAGLHLDARQQARVAEVLAA